MCVSNGRGTDKISLTYMRYNVYPYILNVTAKTLVLLVVLCHMYYYIFLYKIAIHH